MEDLIKEMGLQFRNIVHHSDGRWSCRIFHSFGGREEFWGHTPLEALTNASDYLNQFDE